MLCSPSQCRQGVLWGHSQLRSLERLRELSLELQETAADSSAIECSAAGHVLTYSKGGHSVSVEWTQVKPPHRRLPRTDQAYAGWLVVHHGMCQSI